VFGENLTTEGADANGALIGERWRIGPDLILEASAPRIPCGTFQGWLAQAGWIKRFTLAAMPGAYFRVVEPGEIQAGDPIEIVHRPDHDVSIAMSFRALTMEPDLLPRLLVADSLPEELKDLARRRTASAIRISPRAPVATASAGWLASSQRTRGSRRNQDSWRRANRLVAFVVSSLASSRVHSPSR